MEAGWSEAATSLRELTWVHQCRKRPGKVPSEAACPCGPFDLRLPAPRNGERINLSCFWPWSLWQLSWQSKKLPKSSIVDLSSVSNTQDLKHQGRTVAKGTDNKADQDLRGEDRQAIQEVLWWQNCAKKMVSAARR